MSLRDFAVIKASDKITIIMLKISQHLENVGCFYGGNNRQFWLCCKLYI